MRPERVKNLKIGVVQHSFLSDVETNQARNLSAIANLAAEGARLIVLSELHDSLYFCQTENVDNFSVSPSVLRKRDMRLILMFPSMFMLASLFS